MRSIRSTIGNFIQKTGFLRLPLVRLARSHFRILFYHIVCDEIPVYYFHDKAIRIHDFKEQIRFLKQHFTFISLPEALEKAESGRSLQGYISLTTDDGFLENLTVVAPILQEEKIPACFFLLNDCIDNKSLMWRNKLACIYNTMGENRSGELMRDFAAQHDVPFPGKRDNILTWSRNAFPMNRKESLTATLWEWAGMEPVRDFLDKYTPYLTLDQIKHLVDAGFNIGAHTNSHPVCSQLTFEELESEVIGSMLGIRSKTGMDITMFSYPFEKRPPREMEQKLIDKHRDMLKVMLGIRNNMNNKHPYKWERDLQESDPGDASFRFLVLPMIRKLSGI